jgi:cytoskeleton protein RodZ
MGTFGVRLRSERESRGLGRAEVARATQVWAHYLAALEHEDFDDLPDGDTAQGYLRTYAEYLGLDPDPVVAEFLGEIEARRPAPAESEVGTPEPEPGMAASETVEPRPPASVGPLPREVEPCEPAPAEANPERIEARPGMGVEPLTADVEAFDSAPAEAAPEPIEPVEPTPSPVEAAPDEPEPCEPVPAAKAPEPIGTHSPEPAEPAASEVETGLPELAESVPAGTESELPAAHTVSVQPRGSPKRLALVLGACGLAVVLVWWGLQWIGAAPDPVADAGAGPVEDPSEAQRLPAAPVPPATAAPGQPAPEIAPADLSLNPAPAETRAEENAPPPVAAAGPLSVAEHGVGTAVENNRLVGQADRFSEGTRVWFWTRVVGGTRGQRIRHVWIREGSVISSATLKLGGSHWRTHSRKTLFPGSAGSWTVEARDAAGNLLARSDFTCTP